MTVRQVATAWPACAALFENYPSARVDGRWTLQELTPFARSCGIDSAALLKRLSSLADVPIEPVARRQVASPIPLVFLALGITLTLGASWGVILLLRIAVGVNYATVPAMDVHIHGVAQLWGWMALFIFAVGAHLLRQTTVTPAPLWLERLAALFVLLGIVVLFTSLSQTVHRAFPATDIVGSSCFLVAAILFSFSVAVSLRGAVKSQKRHGFIFLVAWLCIWAATDLYLRLRYSTHTVLPDPARALLIVLPVLGLGVNAIYGFGIRLIPGLLNITHPRQAFFSKALMSHNAGLILFITPFHWVRVIGAAMMLCGAVLYVIGMDGLRSKPSRRLYGIDPRGNILIRVAFFWLVAGLAMILIETIVPGLPHAYSGAWRHALTVGFITTMIMGVGQRIIPVFLKQPLASTRWMLIGAALIIVGNAGRVSLELATLGHWTWAYRLMGVTGLFELTALALFAANLAMTVRNRYRTYSGSSPLRPGVRVREAINAFPALQTRLREMGVTMFDQAPFVAPSMTFGALALSSGHEPDEFLKELTDHLDSYHFHDALNTNA